MRPDHDESDPTRPDDLREPPRHGYQGDRAEAPLGPNIPAALTIAFSRESGARGGTIGRRVGGKLDWQVYDQELLEYMAQDTVVRQGVLENLTPVATVWVEEQLQQLLREQNISQHPSIQNLARVVLALGAQGEAVLIGRGAGFILPRESTLHVRMIAPLEERIGYMSEWMRLTREEAAAKVRDSDARRNEYISTHFHRNPDEVHQYDILLNASLLGEDVCAELIAQAARARSAQFAEPMDELVS
jgi:cytidylate kinase